MVDINALFYGLLTLAHSKSAGSLYSVAGFADYLLDFIIKTGTYKKTLAQGVDLLE
ncbi:MAG: hypothetical protein ACJAYG_000880 [Oceanicoccus sp.]